MGRFPVRRLSEEFTIKILNVNDSRPGGQISDS
jgi:hypothetical protein